LAAAVNKEIEKMDMDVTLFQANLLRIILTEYGPEDLTLEQEEFLDNLANNIRDCSEAGTTLHLNLA
jgi:hypothetical protein